MGTVWHIVPCDDIKEHSQNSAVPCKCEPREEYEKGNIFVVHNAYDGREFFEADKAEQKVH